ncbi:MAG: cell envelope integrity protein CreD [Thermoanaerobaculales bacterium]
MRFASQATMLTVKLVVIGVLGLALWIPTSIVGMLVHERAQRRDEVVAEVSATWGRAQVVEGPVLSVPVNTWEEDEDGGRRRRIAWVHQLPDSLKVRGSVEPEVRYRSIYEVVLYRGEIHLEGTFPAPNPTAWGVDPEDVLWDRAVLTFGVSDPKGLRAVPRLLVGGEDLKLEPGAGQGPFSDGLGAAIDLSPVSGTTGWSPLLFEIGVELAGSESLHFLPTARETVVELTAPWPDPSFQGAFLPLERSVDEEGFSASWKVLALHREAPQSWLSHAEFDDGYGGVLRRASFGVRLLFPVDAYQRTTRSVKYSVLFSLLTFLGFFAVEVGGRSSIHPVQYIVIGFALCLFYTLLLSLSELMAFDFAYLLAGVVIVAMITAYIHGIVRRGRLTLLCAGVLATVYSCLFVMLQLEELALLMGTVLLLLLCGVVMLLTRRLTWSHPE